MISYSARASLFVARADQAGGGAVQAASLDLKARPRCYDGGSPTDRIASTGYLMRRVAI